MSHSLDLRHPMRDVDDGDALAAQEGYEIDETGRIHPVERRGRLVHDKDRGVDRERRGDFDGLLLRDGQAARERVGRDGRVETLEQPACVLAHFAPVDNTKWPGFDAEKDTFSATVR